MPRHTLKYLTLRYEKSKECLEIFVDEVIVTHKTSSLYISQIIIQEGKYLFA
jgi:hypothetical protein